MFWKNLLSLNSNLLNYFFVDKLPKTLATMWRTNLRRLEFEWRRIRQMNLVTLAKKTLTKIVGLGLGLLLLPLTVLLHLAGYRHVNIFTDRIGHLALEPDCLLKEQALGHIAEKKWIMLAPPNRVANEHLLTYWQPHFIIVRSPYSCFLIRSMSQWGVMRYNIAKYLRALGTTQAAYSISREWGNRRPLLQVSPTDQQWGNAQLEKLGLPKNSWFVCVHVREAGFSPIDEELHRHRNSDIAHTVLAMQEIVRRGGWVVRIGDPTMSQLSPLEQVIDYAHHQLKSDRLDVVLCASARFTLGNTSGIALVSSIFGIPCALANVIPMSTLWFYSRDISIPKLLWCRNQRRLLQIDEILKSAIANFQYASFYDHRGLEPVENTAQDILLLVKEMLDRLEENFIDTPYDDQLRRGIQALFRPGHYAYGSAARISASFLREHSDLLQRSTYSAKQERSSEELNSIG